MKSPILLRCLALFAVACAFSSAFAADARKKLVMLIAEPEYDTARTLPEFASAHLAADFRVVIVGGPAAAGATSFDNLREIADADVLLVSVRRRTPPEAQLAAIRRHVLAGKPVVGIRTASHAFVLAKNQKPAAGNADWPDWDATVIGGNYANHHGKGPPTVVTKTGPDHAILEGVTLPFSSESTLYRNTPLRAGAVALITGTIPNQPAEPLAWTFTRADGGKTFYTSLGSPGDFKNPSFVRLLRNGLIWATK